VYILNKIVGNKMHRYYAWLGKSGSLSFGRLCLPGRPATTEEAQPLWDALKKAGKKWNAETMQVEDVPERERIMDFLQSYENNIKWSDVKLCWLIEGYLKYREGKNENKR
jgi:hypothetical protein